MHSMKNIVSSISPRWWLLTVASAAGIAALSLRAFESQESKNRRVELKRQKELRALADRIAIYGKAVHQRYPTGDVVVSERDLAAQLRKRPESVITALNLLLTEQKVQRAPVQGYWKLNNAAQS
jgi:hypothetical protein